MTTATLAHSRDHSLTFPRITRSEYIKQFTLTSTFVTLGATVFGWVAITWIAIGSSNMVGPDGQPDLSWISQAPIGLVQLPAYVLPILGTLAITNEYASGMIRSTLAAVPSRVPVLWAKALVLSIVAVAVGIVGVLLNIVGAILLGPAGSAGAIFDAASLGTYVRGFGLLVAFTLLGLAIGFLIRSTAGSVGAILGLLFFLPMILQMASGAITWLRDVLPYLPDQAAMAFIGQGGSNSLSATAGGFVLLAWVAVALGGAWLVLRKRDV